MDRRLKPGDTVYIIENNIHIRPCSVLRVSGGFVTVAFSRESATRLRSDRVYQSKEEAERHILGRR